MFFLSLTIWVIESQAIALPFVSVFEGLFKLHYKILESSKGKGGRGRGEGKLLEGGCPCGSRSFVYV